MWVLKHPKDPGEWGHDCGSSPPSQKRGCEVKVHLCFINCDFIIYQDQLETILLQFFAHP